MVNLHNRAVEQNPLIERTASMAANTVSALVLPDSLLAKEATDILREYSTDLAH